MEPARTYCGGSGPEAMGVAEKERAASSSGSHEGMAVSGDGEWASRSIVKGRASFLFFEEDVLTVSCPGSSGVRFGYRGGRKVCSDPGASEGLMEQPHASEKETRGGLRQSWGDKGMKTQNANCE